MPLGMCSGLGVLTAAAMNENPLSSKYMDQVRRLSLQLTSSA